ncbi:hypothetical protein ACS2BX_25920 [Bacillus cereus group sp. BceL300]|uniref:hypothetical protein n=1 Tax=Bacillus cereus group sp. BceL300 TaxID=3444985 RepID=UPI003F24D4F6
METTMAIGHVRVVKHDKETGEVVFDRTYKNKITDFARKQSAALWAGQYVKTPSQIILGTGTNVNGPQSSDTALWAPIAASKKKMSYAETFLNYYVQYSATYMQSEVLGTLTSGNPTQSIALTEAGLLDDDGNLWAHVALTDVTHDNTSTLSVQWQVMHDAN